MPRARNKLYHSSEAKPAQSVPSGKRLCVDWSGDLPLGPQFGSFGLLATKQIHLAQRAV
jgi:hypothetical protein